MGILCVIDVMGRFVLFHPRPTKTELNGRALQLHGPQGSGYALLGKAGG